MSEIAIYLSPVDLEFDIPEAKGTQWKDQIEIYQKVFPTLENVQIAIIGVNEVRGSEFNAIDNSHDIESIRKFLYQLEWHFHFPKLADLGNVLPGKEITDTYFALENVVNYLVKNDIIPIIIGGSHDLTFAQFKGYEKLEQLVNIVQIDYKFDIGELDDNLDSGTFLSKIISYQPNFLFNFSNIGHQGYFNSSRKIELMDKMFFETLRLGEMNRQIEFTEPLIRNADMVSFDLKSINSSYFPGNPIPMPNGINGEQACQMMWYAGLSDKLSSIGLYGFSNDDKSIGALLIAEMIWYFAEGYSHRKGDYPKENIRNYTKYTINLNDEEHELIFYKSPKSDRWWVEIPYPDGKEARYFRHLIAPCTYDDYKIASEGDMPDIWWKTYQKLI